MKLVLLSDPHMTSINPLARLDDIRETSNSKMKFIISWAANNKAVIISSGDLLDRPRDWFVLQDMIRLCRIYQVPFFSVYGQHDTYMYSETVKPYTTLGALIGMGAIKQPTSKHTSIYKNVNLYGASFGEKVPVPAKGSVNVLAIHAPIAKQALFPGHDFMDAKKFLKKHKLYDLIICGDIHQRFLFKIGKRYICNTGPILRLDATTYNMQHEPAFYVADVRSTGVTKISKVKIPCQPAEKVLSRDHLEDKKQSTEMLNDFIENVEADVDLSIDVGENVKKVIAENKIDETDPRVAEILSEVMSDVDT
jgi:DNA repair exonuclease SbcCD nuclease subunit